MRIANANLNANGSAMPTLRLEGLEKSGEGEDSGNELRRNILSSGLRTGVPDVLRLAEPALPGNASANSLYLEVIALL